VRAMGIGERISVVATGLGKGCRDDLLNAIAERGWAVDLTEDAQELASWAASGAYHLGIIVCPRPHELPKSTVRTLMSLQTDMSVIFLLPADCQIAECAPLMGATSDQIHRLDSPTTELMETLQYELQSVLSNQPEYTVVCVDDDEEFLASLNAFLPARLEKGLPRFALNLEFFVNPEEVLDEITTIGGSRPAVIISDQMMPELTGIELLQQAKNFCPETRCVLLTGHAALDSAVTAINEQVLDKYYFKPVEDPVDFANNIRHLLLEHHLHARAHTQRSHLMSQFEFIRAVSATKNIDKALSLTLDFLREHVNPRQGVIALGQEGRCTVRAGFALPGELPIGTEVHRHSIFEYVLRTRRPIVVNAENAFPSDVSTEPFESSSLMALPLIWGDVVPGVILMAGRDGNRTFTRDERMLVSFVADVTAMTVSGFDDRRALEGVYLGTMATLMEAVEAKDVYTRGHTDRVTELAAAFAETLGIKGEQLETIRRAAALHDIGKIALPDKIMLKPGPLDSEERATVQEHSARAEKMLQHLSFLGSVRMIVRSHHERYDGTGYPDGLEGEEIPFGARILTIVDAYDAMTSVRPYRGARGHEEALGEIAANAGKQFDPKLAAAFLEMMEKRQRERSLALSDAELVTHDRS